jgi:hypothetical protein
MDWEKWNAICTAIAVFVAAAAFIYDKVDAALAEVQRAKISQYEQAQMLFPLVGQAIVVAKITVQAQAEAREIQISLSDLRKRYGFPAQERMEKLLKRPSDFPPDLAMRMLRTLSYGYRTNIAIENCWTENPDTPGWGVINLGSCADAKGLIEAMQGALEIIYEQLMPLAPGVALER